MTICGTYPVTGTLITGANAWVATTIVYADTVVWTCRVILTGLWAWVLTLQGFVVARWIVAVGDDTVEDQLAICIEICMASITVVGYALGVGLSFALCRGARVNDA